MKELYENFEQLWNSGTPFVQVTIVSVKGSAPQEVGAKALITSEGLKFGTVGGGKVEAHCIEFSKDLISSPESNSERKVLKTWNLQRDIGMTCGGEVSFFFETCNHRVWEIAVFGAGHVAQALVPLLTTLNCRVTCIDNRIEWLSKLKDNPKLRKLNPNQHREVVSELASDTFIISMTQGHSLDVPVLKELFDQKFKTKFIGVIGSERKASTLKKELEAQGVSNKFLQELRCPIGLALGNNTPEEIAVSITAQLLQERDAD